MLSPKTAPLPPESTFFSLSGPVDSLPAERMTSFHRDMRAYWGAKRGTRRAPRRRDFDPSDLPGLLPHLALWGCDGPGDYRCRLAGTRIDAEVGRPLTGMTLTDIPCTRLLEVRREFDAVRDLAHGTLAERTMNWAGKSYRYYRHLLLPLLDDRDDVSTLLSVMTFHRTDERMTAM